MGMRRRYSFLVVPLKLEAPKCGPLQKQVIRAIKEYLWVFPKRRWVPFSEILRRLPGKKPSEVRDALERLEKRGLVVIKERCDQPSARRK